MECEQEQRTCFDFSVRRIGRCQEDVDQWQICEIVGTGGLAWARKALTDV